MTRALSTILVAGVISAQAGLTSLTSLTGLTGLTGLWYRDDSRSDDPEAKIEAAVAGLITKMSRGRRSRDDLDPRVVQQLQRLVDTFVQYAEELDIEQDDGELIVDDGGPRLRIFYLDAEKHERQMPNGTRLETTATVRGSQIDIYQKTSEGAEIYERYALSRDGDEMLLTVRLDDEQLEEPLVIRNVYRRGD